MEPTSATLTYAAVAYCIALLSPRAAQRHKAGIRTCLRPQMSGCMLTEAQFKGVDARGADFTDSVRAIYFIFYTCTPPYMLYFMLGVLTSPTA